MQNNRLQTNNNQVQQINFQIIKKHFFKLCALIHLDLYTSTPL